MDENDDGFTLWCGNIPDRTSEEILYELFLQAGPVSKVKIPVNRENRQANFGFITFKHIASVAYAIELFESTHLYGRRLVLKRRQSSQQYSNHQERNTPPVQYSNADRSIPPQNVQMERFSPPLQLANVPYTPNNLMPRNRNDNHNNPTSQYNKQHSGHWQSNRRNRHEDSKPYYRQQGSSRWSHR